MIHLEAWYREAQGDKAFQEAVRDFRKSMAFEDLAIVLRQAIRSGFHEIREQAALLHQEYGAKVIREALDPKYVTANARDSSLHTLMAESAPSLPESYHFKASLVPLLEDSLKKGTAVYAVFSTSGMLGDPSILQRVSRISIGDLVTVLRHVVEDIKKQRELYG